MTATHTAPAALEDAQLHPDALDIGENVRDSVCGAFIGECFR